MNRFLGAAGLAALCLFPAALGAQDVTLSSPDGSVTLSGDLVAFDGEFYRLESQFGPLTVAAADVSCDGPGCPTLSDYIPEIGFVGAPVLADRLLPVLIQRFALTRGLSLARIEGAETTTFEFGRGDGAARRVVGRFRITAAVTGAGFAALADGQAQIVMAARPPRADERQALAAVGRDESAGPGRGRIVALDAIVPLVARANPAGPLTYEELGRLAAGEITNWQGLGGLDAPIALHLVDPDGGLMENFVDRIIQPLGLSLSPAATLHADAASLSDAVAANPFALGVGRFSEVGNARALPLGGRCGFSQAARDATIKTGDYALTAPLVLYPPRDRLPVLVRDFLEFTQGAAAGRVVRRAGFINQDVEAFPFDLQGQRLANAIIHAGSDVTLEDLQVMVARLSEATRLTPTFRFPGGETHLDAVSLAAADRLARLIEAGAHDGRELIFAGFSDGEGSAEANRALARDRAIAVRDAVQLAAPAADLGRVGFRIAAFGEALPMACDDTDWGRQVNRRVEVWLR